ncbi:lysophosphatidic acid receptor 1-like [Dendronephthya gigantea]|uniref:lysophosphatidic acid receptor 1-like n=1 Tax=Dendronephthya gigantea TaxID=151771 RepID=UPI00106B2476|nr:lysophosphatidic acid receptor 1-like [Dendronephthya gigantea]
MAPTELVLEFDEEFTIISSILIFIGFICNLILLICMIKDPLHIFRNPSSYLIINLAIADMESCVAQLIFNGLLIVGQLDTARLVFESGITFFGPDVSFMCLLSLAIERYLCVTKPILYRVHFTGKKIVALIAFIWFLHIARVAGIIYSLKADIVDIKDVKIITLFLHVVFILFCLICNIATMSHFNKTRARELQEGTGNHAPSARVRTQRRFVVTMVIISSCLVVTIVPFTVLKFLTEVRDIPLPVEAIAIVQTFYIINFGINPALYFWRMPRYRKSIIAVLCCKKGNI